MGSESGEDKNHGGGEPQNGRQANGRNQGATTGAVAGWGGTDQGGEKHRCENGRPVRAIKQQQNDGGGQ